MIAGRAAKEPFDYLIISILQSECQSDAGMLTKQTNAILWWFFPQTTKRKYWSVPALHKLRKKYAFAGYLMAHKTKNITFKEKLEGGQPVSLLPTAVKIKQPTVVVCNI